MTKHEFLHKLQAERQRWEALWVDVNYSDLPEPTLGDKMNLRDVLYHVAWYEREMVEVLQLRALVGSPWWDLPLDERNANILAEGQPFSLLDTYRQEQQVYAELLSQINLLSDDQLEHASYFNDMPPDWKPWEMLASNTYEHYPQHLEDIQG